ncbi:hypothetical protein UA08_03949 [Talaromyces atroroseus]|uniref:Zn(2)-C6 fungal-type domain-containing protein n=1 Tax=Talaromyces atroroseus TaxID=1441469 RepID=A0A1Q5Q8R9_TALAT|nr:hypothetical protein UA08_03949 [Talaromyces atroroseus]OKL60462.1 hypothetical protein UA08_03949 [Talaromyces atroroseus]
MLRSNHGCWSCRIRRKKCDETKPVCTTCTSRNITCHGYGSKPGWLDGGEQEKRIARDLKNQIADNLRKNRKRRSPRNIQSYAGDSARHGNVAGVIHGSFALNTNLTKPPFSALAATSSMVSERLTSYREAELIMHYMDAVFPLQFRFHAPDAKGRGWLLWLIVQSGPLYHAALSLSALHQSIRMSVEFRNSYTELANYHAQALTDLRQFLQRIQENNDTDERSRKIEVLSCGVSLISFELFQGGTSDWQLHLNALISILLGGHASSVIELLRETRQSSNSLGESLAWQGTALSFLITVILWFDLLSCASTNCAPRMPYRSLLDANIVDMSTTMGVRNNVMRAIGDIASLSADNILVHSRIEPSILIERRAIEQSLKRELEILEDEVPLSPSTSKLAPLEHMEKVRDVTRVFATAALVQLGAIFPGNGSGGHTIHDAIEQNMAAIKSIRNSQDVRGLIWPICISGSMAQDEQQQFYEATIRSALNDTPRDFGNCTTLLDILRWCWEKRNEYSSYEVDWRHAMADIGTCLLV